ncbi:MAG: hypothetical protein VX776_11420, partial [Planctomycetota bacterium]|nr:hypothetical protein [Planctomycetota bacterium]
MNKKTKTQTDLRGGMHELLLRHPKSLDWGLPGYLHAPKGDIRNWQENAERHDCSAIAVLEALKAAYELSSQFEKEVRVDETVASLAQYAELVLQHNKLRENPWNVLIAGVEIPAVLSAVSPAHKDVRKLMKSAGELLGKSAVDLFDEEGVIVARHFPWYAAILATWTRCLRALSRRQINLKLKKSFFATFEWAVRQLLRCSNGNRGISDLAGNTIKLPKAFITSLLDLGGDISDKRLASKLGYPQTEYSKPVADHYLPDATLHSNDSQVTVMRTGWGAKRREVYIRYHQQEVFLEIASAGVVLFSGDIGSQLIVDGVPLVSSGSWQEVCWESDDDVDYLELEITCAGGWKVQKHILLAKDDNLVLIGNAVLGAGTRNDISLQQPLPCGEGIRFFASEEHHEGFVWGENPAGMVLPLALPEWKTATSNGRLRSDDGIVHYELSAREVTGMYAPLLLVLDRKAGLRKYTW